MSDVLTETVTTPETYPAQKRVPVGAVARLFGCCPSTVYGWCVRGILPATRLPGGQHYRILWADAVGLWELSKTAVIVSPETPFSQYETKSQRAARGEKARQEALAMKPRGAKAKPKRVARA